MWCITDFGKSGLTSLFHYSHWLIRGKAFSHVSTSKPQSTFKIVSQKNLASLAWLLLGVHINISSYSIGEKNVTSWVSLALQYAKCQMSTISTPVSYWLKKS